MKISSFSVLLTMGLLSAVTFAEGAQAQTYATIYVAPTAGNIPPGESTPAGNDSTGTGSITAPYATLNKARTAVAKLTATPSKVTGNINVIFRGGTYPMTSPVNFAASDSGVNGYNVIYTANTGEVPILSGGTAIASSAWSLVSGTSNIYKATVGTSASFRQLYVNGRHVFRARTPNAASMSRIVSWNTSDDTITVNTSDLGAMNTSSVTAEMVIARSWDQNRLLVSSVSNLGNGQSKLSFKNPAGTNPFLVASYKGMDSQQSYYLENDYNFLGAQGQGEWFLNSATGVLYYEVNSGESIGSDAIVYPQAQTLINMQGNTPETSVHNIQFVGLTFAYTGWNTPSTQGWLGGQAGIPEGSSTPTSTSTPPTPPSTMTTSAVFLNNTSNVTFEGDTFTHLGGQALTLFSGCSNDTIDGNNITDVSANGLSIDQEFNGSPSDSQTTCSNDTVTNNCVSYCGVDYWGSVGIFGGYVNHATIEHNEVAYLPYTGLSVGWGWTLSSNPSSNNLIEYNHIHNVMTLLHDGAAIYTLSNQPGTTISNNYIHNVRRSAWTEWSPIAAMYLDQGSSNITISNNVCINVEDQFNSNTTGANTINLNNSMVASVVDQSGPGSAYLPSKAMPSLVGCWTFDSAPGGSGTAVADSSGYGNNGTTLGNVTTGSGISGNALHFDGTSGFTVPDSPSLRVQNFTISAWVKPDVPFGQMTSAYPMLLSKQNYSGNAGYILTVLSPNSNTIGIRILTGASNSNDQSVTYTEPSSGYWDLITATYDGTSLRIYRNGLLESSSAIGLHALNADATSLSFGYGFQGWMDDVRLYNAALSPDDIRTLYCMNVDTSLVGRWPLDDGNLYRVSDITGNANATGAEDYGAFSGTPTWVVDAYGLASLSFNASAPSVSVADTPALWVQQYTISAWINPSTTFANMGSGYPYLVSKLHWSSSCGYLLGQTNQSSNILGNRFMMGVSSYEQAAFTEPYSGSWINVVGTYDGNTVSIYANGVLQSQQVVGYFAIPSDYTPLTFGGSGYLGQMRDVRVYNRALSPTEVQLLGP